MDVAQRGVERRSFPDFRGFPPPHFRDQQLVVGAAHMGERGLAEALDEFDDAGYGERTR